jgi:Mu transposase, C-terminal domain
LLSLPPAPYLVVERTTRVVARDGFFSFEGRPYHVPDAERGERVELVLGATELEVCSIHDRRILARHERGRPLKALPDPVKDSVPLAQVLSAMPDPEVHRRPLARYQEAIDG